MSLDINFLFAVGLLFSGTVAVYFMNKHDNKRISKYYSIEIKKLIDAVKNSRSIVHNRALKQTLSIFNSNIDTAENFHYFNGYYNACIYCELMNKEIDDIEEAKK